MSIYRYAKKDSEASPAKGIPADKKENEKNKQVSIDKPSRFSTFTGASGGQS